MNRQILLSASKEKLAAALEILFASVDAYVPFDPARHYTPKEREPYDALTDRYLRAFESSLKFFRTLPRPASRQIREYRTGRYAKAADVGQRKGTQRPGIAAE